MVGGVDEEVSVVVDDEVVDIYEGLVDGELVDVEDDFFGGGWCIGEFMIVDGVLFFLFGVGVVDVVVFVGGDGLVGFFYVVDYFVIEFFVEWFCGGGDGVGVGVFCF